MTDTSMHFKIPPAHVAAYEEAIYRIDSPYGPVDLVIGQPDERLSDALRQRGVGRVMLITACNPFSQNLPDSENARRNDTLRRALDEAGLTHWSSRGRDAAGEWPAEEGFCVLDADDAQADGWMAQFGQNAVVFFTAADSVAQLGFHPRAAQRAATPG